MGKCLSTCCNRGRCGNLAIPTGCPHGNLCHLSSSSQSHALQLHHQLHHGTNSSTNSTVHYRIVGGTVVSQAPGGVGHTIVANFGPGATAASSRGPGAKVASTTNAFTSCDKNHPHSLYHHAGSFTSGSTPTDSRPDSWGSCPGNVTPGSIISFGATGAFPGQLPQCHHSEYCIASYPKQINIPSNKEKGLPHDTGSKSKVFSQYTKLPNLCKSKKEKEGKPRPKSIVVAYPHENVNLTKTSSHPDQKKPSHKDTKRSSKNKNDARKLETTPIAPGATGDAGANDATGGRPDWANQLFEKYKDADEDVILIAGIEGLCSDLALHPEDFRVLVFAWLCGAETMCRFSRPEFVTGCKRLKNPRNAAEIRSRLPAAVDRLKDDDTEFKELYRWAFGFGLEKDVGQRTLPASMAIELWKIVFAIRKPPILYTWLFYLEKHSQVRGIPKDTWNMFLNFTEVVGVDLESYDDGEAWPSLFDDFVEFALSDTAVHTDHCAIGADLNHNGPEAGVAARAEDATSEDLLVDHTACVNVEMFV